MIPMTASAASSGKCGSNVNWSLSSNGVLTISGTGPMNDYGKYDNDEASGDYYDYEEKPTPWSNHWSSIHTVVIKNGVTTIGRGAFYGMMNLTSVTLPDSITTIGNYAFYYCDALTNVTLPDSVTSIGKHAFHCCAALTTVTLPNSLTSIKERAFAECEALTRISIPDSVTSISDFAFVFCTNLNSASIGRGVTKIGQQIFMGCNNLREVHFLGNAPTMKDRTFANVTATAYYPAANSTWTSKVKKDYGGDLTWVSSEAKLSAPKVSASNSVSSGKVKLTWNKIDGAAEYQIYRATSKNGTYKKMKTVTGTSYTNTVAEAGKLYYYYVVAVAKNGNVTDKSNIVCRTCDLARPEVTVSNVASTGKNKISWNAVEGATKYTLYIYDKNGDLIKSASTSKTSITHNSGKTGNVYTYKVKAKCTVDAATSAYSAAKSRTCDLPRPEASVTLNASGKPVIRWGTVSGAVKYTLYIYNPDGSLVKTASTTGTKITHNSAENGVRYSYRVTAVHTKSSANSAKSPKVSAPAANN